MVRFFVLILVSSLFISGCLESEAEDDKVIVRTLADPHERIDADRDLVFEGPIHGEVFFVQKIQRSFPPDTVVSVRFVPTGAPGITYIGAASEFMWNQSMHAPVLLTRGIAHTSFPDHTFVGGISPPPSVPGELALGLFAYAHVPGELTVRVKVPGAEAAYHWEPFVRSPPGEILFRDEFPANGASYDRTVPVSEEEGVLLFFDKLLGEGGGTRDLEIGDRFPYHWYAQGEAEDCYENKNVYSAVGSPTFGSGVLPIHIEEDSGHALQSLIGVTWRSGIETKMLEHGTEEFVVILGAGEDCHMVKGPGASW